MRCNFQNILAFFELSIAIGHFGFFFFLYELKIYFYHRFKLKMYEQICELHEQL